jgi:hypothetical protein
MSSSSQAYMHIATYKRDNNNKPQRIPGGTERAKSACCTENSWPFAHKAQSLPMIPHCNRTWPTGQRPYRDHEVKCNLTKSPDMLSYWPSPEKARANPACPDRNSLGAQGLTGYLLYISGVRALYLSSRIIIVTLLLIYLTVWSLNAKAQRSSDARRRIMIPGSLG